MSGKDIVVVGASAGGIEALRTLVGGLPKDFAASLFIVLHTSSQSPGVLGEILDRAGVLAAANAKDRERIRPSRIYIAPPDHHLVLEPGLVRVTRGPKENRFRPAIDPLFRSAAQVYGPRVIGVILTGGLDDGSSGLWTIKQLGGTAIVQDPNDAFAPSMPFSALNHVKVDYCLPLSDIAPLLVQLTSVLVEEEGEFPVPEEVNIEVGIAKEIKALDAGVLKLGEPSSYACPECHGVLLQLKEGNRFRFRCHTGHAYSADSLLAEIKKGIEDALWNAIRSIEEGEILMTHLAEHAEENDSSKGANLYLKGAVEARMQANLVRQAVMDQHLSEAIPGEGAHSQ